MRRQLCVLLIFNIGFVLTVMSQQKGPEFLFRESQDAKVYFLDGSFSNEKINYNVRGNELYFIDKSDGFEKIVSSTEKIRVIKVDNRNFILVKGHLQEVLPTTPPIYVEYLAKIQTKAQNAGYGSTSQTSSITSYSIGQQGLLAPEAKEIEAMGFNYNFWIEKNGSKKQFSNFRQFLKIYSKHKNVLDEYIKSNNIEFNNIEGIVNLCLYAESLN